MFQINPRPTLANGNTLLHKAIRLGIYTLFTEAFSFENKTDCKIQIFWTGFKTTIELLVEKDANVNEEHGERKLTPLHTLVAADRSGVEWTNDDTISKLN